MRQLKKYFIISFISCALLISGAFAGYYAGRMGVMCGSSSAHVMTSDMISENGIVFPKGTIVPLKSCAYMQRFDWEFAIDNSVELKKIEFNLKDENGFSRLEEIE